MKAAIHQPHYFPWIGYFDKMAKADTFVILDQVQFEKGSQMVRNRVLDGNGEIKYITISGDTKDFLNREYRELLTKDVDAICNAIGVDTYFSGRGASMTYLNREKFAENGVKIVFQDFKHPIYPQCSTSEFVPGVSILDMLFNCGITESRRIFWENVNAAHEFEKNEA